MLGLLAYASLFSFFVYGASAPPNREVRGLLYQPNVQLVVDQGMRESDVVHSAGYDPL